VRGTPATAAYQFHFLLATDSPHIFSHSFLRAKEVKWVQNESEMEGLAFRVQVWPSGLRRCVQVAVLFGGRRFESCGLQKLFCSFFLFLIFFIPIQMINCIYLKVNAFFDPIKFLI
jgi:hypothetical protein